MQPFPAPTSASAADVDRQWADLVGLTLSVCRELRRYRPGDRLTPSQVVVLEHLEREGPTAPSLIAAATGLQRTNLSTTLRGLERSGLVRRQADPRDGRGITVSATPRGTQRYDQVRREWAGLVAGAAAGGDVHLGAALTLLTTIRDGLSTTRHHRRPSA